MSLTRMKQGVVCIGSEPNIVREFFVNKLLTYLLGYY